MPGADVTDVETGTKGGREIPRIAQNPKVVLVEARFEVCVAVLASVHHPAPPHPRRKPGHTSSANSAHSFGAHVQIKTGFGGESLKQRYLYT